MHSVIFIGGESPAPEDTEEYFKSSPAVDNSIAADSGLETLDSYNSHYKGRIDFYPSHILGDMDSLQDRKLLEKYGRAEKTTFPEDKDYTDTELALEQAKGLCRDGKNDRITMIGGNGGRADHFIGIYETFSSSSHADVWLCGNQSVWLLEDGCSLEVSKINPSQMISIARTAGAFAGGKIKSSGLEWGDSAMRKRGMPSISNRISKEWFRENKKVSIKADGASFLVFLPISSAVEIFKV